MGNTNTQYRGNHIPKVITPEDKVRLKELLRLILSDTDFSKNNDIELEKMMKSTARVVSLKFIESIISVHDYADETMFFKFFEIYYTDLNSRVTLKCNINMEFKHDEFKIKKI